MVKPYARPLSEEALGSIENGIDVNEEIIKELESYLSYSPREGPGALDVSKTKKNLVAAKRRLKGLEQRLERHEAALEVAERKKRHRPWEL